MSGHHDLIASVPLFSNLPKKTIDRLDRLLVERDFPEGHQIVKEGDEGVSFFLITEGTAEVRHGGQVLNHLKAGDYFGDIALLDGQRRSATVTATSPVHCGVLTRWDFIAEVRSNPDMALELLEVMSHRLRDIQDKLGAAQPAAH
jgi:CRP/FNR family cyclic AMP-dependent transcriptional regulator